MWHYIRSNKYSPVLESHIFPTTKTLLWDPTRPSWLAFIGAGVASGSIPKVPNISLSQTPTGSKKQKAAATHIESILEFDDLFRLAS